MAIKIYSALAVAAFGVGASFMACGPAADDGDPTPTPATTTSMPVTSAPGTTSTTAPVTSTTAPGPTEPNDCDGPGEGYVPTLLNDGVCETTAPPNCIINEFAANFQCPTTGSVDGCSDCCWGDDTSLTGGPISYQNGEDSSTIAYTHEDGLVRLVGSTSSYAGFGLWFGPCTDASMWDGLEIQVQGDLGGGQLFVQLQTDENYPKEADKGSCDWEGMGATDAEKWNVCSNPQVEVSGVTVDSLNPFRFKWSEFAGGQPNADVDPLQLRGIQVQIGCAAPASEGDAGAVSTPAEPCAFNLELLDLRWYKEPAL